MDLFIQFNDLMSRGGPVMWVIFITAWIAIIMLIERAFQLQAWINNANKDQHELHKNTAYQPAESNGRKTSPIALLLNRLNWKEIQTKEDLSQQMNIHLAEIIPRLEGKLPTVAVIGTLLPMLGLLGTVVGMIQVFEVIALHGTGNPQEMAHGISQALLTTASGLIIAIPVIFAHHLLIKRVHHLLSITEQCMLIIYHRDLPDEE